MSNISELVQKAREDAETSRTTERDFQTITVPGLEKTSKGIDKGSHIRARSMSDSTQNMTDKVSQIATIVTGSDSLCAVTMSGTVSASETGVGPGPGPVDWMLACSQLTALVNSARLEWAGDEVDGEKQLESLDNLQGELDILSFFVPH